MEIVVAVFSTSNEAHLLGLDGSGKEASVDLLAADWLVSVALDLPEVDHFLHLLDRLIYKDQVRHVPLTTFILLHLLSEPLDGLLGKAHALIVPFVAAREGVYHPDLEEQLLTRLH
eukprot:CAMPEP_0170556600 /NCGR_PEP_ID=MMETSP0211-20121228/17689_1 /TAXON_ID=311385 /ORGANISM="Pseudokeronopsis sp., Strain OXSARD2" /LENGTH=115 /DNA_ID=CAMNT_0010867033 /DNA_START=272 /DNA_END=619 /DNA_ORIENTATION=+